jgi:hypothetical protein
MQLTTKHPFLYYTPLDWFQMSFPIILGRMARSADDKTARTRKGDVGLELATPEEPNRENKEVKCKTEREETQPRYEHTKPRLRFNELAFIINVIDPCEKQ